MDVLNKIKMVANETMPNEEFFSIDIKAMFSNIDVALSKNLLAKHIEAKYHILNLDWKHTQLRSSIYPVMVIILSAITVVTYKNKYTGAVLTRYLSIPLCKCSPPLIIVECTKTIPEVGL